MKIALFGNNKMQFGKVYAPKVIAELSKYGEVSERISKKDLEKNKEFLQECEVAFATWGMLKLTKEEIETYLPKLKAIFYAAGTVQYFAKPFLEKGIKIFSAAAVNAVPVAEFTYSQIVLANKGYYLSSKRYRLMPLLSLLHSDKSGGNFANKVGIVGLGAIGSSVANSLKALDVEVLAYDPFVPQEKADALNVKLVDLETLFSECNVISNHLANKKELENVYNYKLFKKMKKHSTFINTGRGAQVNQVALAFSLLLHPSRTAVVDVLKREFFPYINPLFWCHNAVITPHIAGSLGNEPQRMAYEMMKSLEKYMNNEENDPSEVTLKKLEMMA